MVSLTGGGCRKRAAALHLFRAVSVLALATVALTPMSATAQSPAEGVVFTGDFESGNLSPWAAQCVNTGLASTETITRGAVGVTIRLVGQGRYAARFNLPTTDKNNACEVLKQRPIGLGTDDYYGLMFLFPRNWREPSPAGWGALIAQFSYQGIHGPPIALAAHAKYVELQMQTGLCRRAGSSPEGCAYSSGKGGNLKPMVAIPKPLARGVWHELIVHVHHATDASGAVDVWHRLKGEAGWKMTMSLRGYPTVQWTAEGWSILHFNYTADKVGAYRGPADFPLSVWQDGFVRATSFSAAAAALP